MVNLSVGSADSSPFKGAFRIADSAIGAMQTRWRSPRRDEVIPPYAVPAAQRAPTGRSICIKARKKTAGSQDPAVFILPAYFSVVKQ